MQYVKTTNETPTDTIRAHAKELGLSLSARHAANLLRSIPDVDRAARFLARADRAATIR